MEDVTWQVLCRGRDADTGGRVMIMWGEKLSQ
jgi:hypothetical protein